MKLAETNKYVKDKQSEYMSTFFLVYIKMKLAETNKYVKDKHFTNNVYIFL